MKKTQATRGLGRVCDLGCERWPGFFSLCFCFFFLPSLGSSMICSGLFFDIYKGWKLSFRDSISMWLPREKICHKDLISTWSSRGKICHIGPHQTMEIESQRLDL